MRQGDPIFLYIFALVMEVFSCLLVEASIELEFQFHPKYAAIGLSHLYFADDVLIFSKVDFHSVLEEFNALSRLRINPSKSYVFCSGLSPQ